MAFKRKKSSKRKMKNFLQEWKQGFKDILAILQEGKFQLAVKQVIVLAVAFLLMVMGSRKMEEQTKSVRQQIESIRVQQSSEQEYLTNKRKLLSLEPQFPEVASKDTWLLSQLLNIFENVDDVKVNTNDPQVENATNPNYTLISKKITFPMKFLPFGKLLADIENRDSYLRISELTIAKSTDPNEMEYNMITMVFNTAFPKEKLAPVLFKDYNKGGTK